MESRTDTILELINKNPGIHFSEIMRETGFKNGVLSHHLSKIEESGQVLVQRSPRVARVYPCGIKVQEDSVNQKSSKSYDEEDHHITIT